ncbi:phage head closure protein [Cetobacterium sp. 2A]|uniref:phage head closure protein n=1 Tax=Cetobacterium sp. 2A TaxID=2754723 RepID=UPI00163D31A0|nr:phage head closure protein [Cetobacterium sp. 2A]MBC2855252.1 phage head closure protein [Cetobacterium sp. 2A]MBC2855301.1 phage head closure protein [Cetobacterium sp. 2A]
MSNLSSRLRNRIGIYKKENIKGKLGTSYEDILIKKVWAEIKFQSGSIVNGEGDTAANNTRFKIRIRKTDIKADYHIVYKGLIYDIEYIYPDFKKNSFIDLMVKLKTE